MNEADMQRHMGDRQIQRERARDNVTERETETEPVRDRHRDGLTETCIYIQRQTETYNTRQRQS